MLRDVVVRLARPGAAGIVSLTVSWFQAVCRSRSALRVHLARAVDWCCGLADGHPQLRTRWIGWRREEQFRRLPGTTRGLLFLVVVSGPCLVCVVADGAAATGRLPLLVAEKFVSPTKFSGTMYKVANRECAGRSHARASGRHADRHGEAKDPYVFPLRRDAGSFAASCGVGVAGAAGRRRSCARFISTSGRFPARAGASPRYCA